MNGSILVVDDRRSMRGVIIDTLSGAGFNCCAADSVDQALKQLTLQPFGLVLHVVFV